ncbi:MAG: non-homologous end-joining DNA ligase [Parcubacteria group bacterium]
MSINKSLDNKIIKANSHKIELKNLDKVLYKPKYNEKITKEEVIDYYQEISPLLLKYSKNRVLTLQRFPNGQAAKGFYQKKYSDYFPKWLSVTEIKLKEGSKQRELVLKNKADLIYLVDQASLSFHAWLSQYNKINSPDRLIFDIDPPKENFKLAKQAAKELKEVLDNLNLKSFLMLTGKKGLHLLIPIKVDYNFDKTKDFAKKISQLLEKRNSSRYTSSVNKGREKKVYIDYLRNSYGQTAICPYSLRDTKKASIATPITWKQLNNSNLKPDIYTIKDIEEIKTREDPWKYFNNYKADLRKAEKKLDILIKKENL